MGEKGIFNKVDTLYTKVVEVIIGDQPLHTLKSRNKNNTTDTKEPLKQTKDLYNSLKEKFLNLGIPKNKDELLYHEVVKKEKALKHTKRQEIEQKAEKTTQNTTVATRAKTPEKNIESTSRKDISPTPKKTDKSTQTKSTDTKNQTDTSTLKGSKKRGKIKKERNTKIDISSNKKSKETNTKTKSAPKGAKKATKIALYIKDIKKHYGEVDEEFVTIIVNNLGPSIYKKDAELVSCSDSKELDTVRKNFLKKKLGIDASKNVLDAAIQDVCIELKSARKKYRATFYYALAKKFKKESMLS